MGRTTKGRNKKARSVNRPLDSSPDPGGASPGAATLRARELLATTRRERVAAAGADANTTAHERDHLVSARAAGTVTLGTPERRAEGDFWRPAPPFPLYGPPFTHAIAPSPLFLRCRRDHLQSKCLMVDIGPLLATLGTPERRAEGDFMAPGAAFSPFWTPLATHVDLSCFLLTTSS